MQVAGKDAEVKFAGMAPGFLAYQVNFQVPPEAPTGSQTLTIAAGQGTSPAGVTTFIGTK